jgi:glutathione S-transferase
MLVLRSSPLSPFGRKVKIAAAILGLADQIKIEVADTDDPSDSLRGQNPLGKIPALILEDGSVLFDSRVIIEYLDWRAGGGRLIPADPGRRFTVLTTQALADGVMDAALLQRYEGVFRGPDARSEKWLDHHRGKAARALEAFEATPPAVVQDVGAIALACALGYLDVRFGGAWRTEHPGLVAWLDAYARATPAFEATRATAPA